MKNKLIIGIGNRLRSDDGVGLFVIDALRQLQLERNSLSSIDLKEASGEGTELMFQWQDYDEVMIVDAVRLASKAGTVHRLNAGVETIPSDMFHYSTHAFSLAEAVELSRSLGDLPETLHIIGIEGANFSYGEQLTPEVENTAKRVSDELFASLNETINT